MDRRCAKEGAFTRLASELESGYLGQDCRLALAFWVVGLLGCWVVGRSTREEFIEKVSKSDESMRRKLTMKEFNHSEIAVWSVFWGLFHPVIDGLMLTRHTYVVSNLRRAKAKPCRWIWTVAMWPTSCESMEHRFRLPWSGKALKNLGKWEAYLLFVGVSNLVTETEASICFWMFTAWHCLVSKVGGTGTLKSTSFPGRRVLQFQCRDFPKHITAANPTSKLITFWWGPLWRFLKMQLKQLEPYFWIRVPSENL